MKKILFILLMAATSAHAVTNIVRNVVETRDANSPIISQSFITASNLTSHAQGSNPTSVVILSTFQAGTNAVVAIGSQKVVFSTNLVADVSLPGQTYTNIFTYTTTLGSNALIRASARGASAGGTAGIVRIKIGSNVVQWGGGIENSTTWPFVAQYSTVLVSNVVINVDYWQRSASPQALSKDVLIFAGLESITNATQFVVEEIK